METIVREAWPSVVDIPMFAEKERLDHRKSYTLEQYEKISDPAETNFTYVNNKNIMSGSPKCSDEKRTNKNELNIEV